MRENAVKKTLAAGERAFGAMIFEFFTPGMPRIVKNAGAQFALYCMEHTGAGFETLKPQFSLCRALGVVPPVRVPGTEYDFILLGTGHVSRGWQRYNGYDRTHFEFPAPSPRTGGAPGGA